MVHEYDVQVICECLNKSINIYVDGACCWLFFCNCISFMESSIALSSASCSVSWPCKDWTKLFEGGRALTGGAVLEWSDLVFLVKKLAIPSRNPLMEEGQLLLELADVEGLFELDVCGWVLVVNVDRIDCIEFIYLSTRGWFFGRGLHSWSLGWRWSKQNVFRHASHVISMTTFLRLHFGNEHRYLYILSSRHPRSRWSLTARSAVSSSFLKTSLLQRGHIGVDKFSGSLQPCTSLE